MDASALATLAEGYELLSTGQLDAALRAFTEAEEFGADADECAGGRWRASMLLGDMEAAWRETDAIRARGIPDLHRFWNGSSPDGQRIIVRCLHGFGDTIQMIRFVPQLLSMTTCVILEVQPRLVPLLNSISFLRRDGLEIITWGENAPSVPPPWDLQIEIMELPYVLRTTQAELPGNTCYLDISADEIIRISEAMGQSQRSRIGLVWTAGKWNPERAIPFEQLRPLLHAPFEFWSLVDSEDFTGARASETMYPLRDSNTLSEGISGLTAVISRLDLVITSDTLAAHIAGALGVPVWVLLPYSADWRWMRGETSPWYPSMKLFRQRESGNWPEVIGRIDTALQTSSLRDISRD